MTKRSWKILIVLLIIIAAVAAWWWMYRPGASPDGTAALIRTTSRGLETTSRKQPECQNLGTSKEGWYIGKTLVAFAQCKKCVTECRNVSTRSAGWYNMCDDELVVYADCSPSLAPTVDKPFCATSGSGEFGWKVRNRIIRSASCTGCAVECRRAGTAEEGWYDGCDNTLILATKCGSPQ